MRLVAPSVDDAFIIANKNADREEGHLSRMIVLRCVFVGAATERSKLRRVTAARCATCVLDHAFVFDADGKRSERLN